MNYDDLFKQSGTEGLYGVYVGIVTDVEDPEDMGRVKVKFPWRDKDDDSHWARLATPMAGDEIGTYFLPDLDDRVLVAFAHGDIHEPFILGGLWTGQQPPQLPNDKENPKREIRSRAEHSITFDDKNRGDKPAGKIEIRSSKRNLENEGHKITISDEDDKIVIEDHNENKITMDDSGVTVESPESIQLKAEKNVEIEAGEDIDIDASGKLNLSSTKKTKIKSSQGMDIKSSMILNVKGKIIKLN